MMYVQERNGKYRFFETYIDPLTKKRRTTSISFERNTAQTRKRAQTALNARIRELTARTGKYSPNSLKSLIAAYSASQAAKVAPQTLAGSKRALKGVEKLLGEDTDISMIDARFVQARLDKSGETPTRKNYRIKHIKALFKWAYRYDYIQSDWTGKLERYKDNERERRAFKYMEKDELNLLLEKMRVSKYKTLTRFLALSGLRIGEALAITAGDIDLAARTITINKSLSLVTGETGGTKTDSSNRTIHIQTELLPVVEEILPECFKGVRYFAYNKYLKENTERVIGRALSPHSLRHTHVSLLAGAGIQLEVIARRCGHADSDVTRDIYLHVTSQMRDRDAALLDAVKLM